MKTPIFYLLMLALSPAIIGAADNKQMFEITIDNTYNEHSAQAVVCLHEPKVKAATIGIISGDNAQVCQEICRYIQSKSHLAATTDSDSDEDFNGENDYALTQDAKENASRFYHNYFDALKAIKREHLNDNTLRIPEWKPQRTPNCILSEEFLATLPKQLSWVSITYNQQLSFVAQTQKFTIFWNDICAKDKSIDFSEKIVSHGNALSFETDGHRISFEVSEEDLKRPVEIDAWTCVIQ